ncbi:MAG: hypothetical protein HEQ35_10010 [Gloeotrichia echinulata IR180]|jgi:hypothetical protein|nr:hypothetical protein [Gloeotrichia echinulata DEX184]
MTAQQVGYPDQPQPLSLLKPLTSQQVEQIIQLLDEWMADESGYDETTWAELTASLDQG